MVLAVLVLSLALFGFRHEDHAILPDELLSHRDLSLDEIRRNSVVRIHMDPTYPRDPGAKLHPPARKDAEVDLREAHNGSENHHNGSENQHNGSENQHNGLENLRISTNSETDKPTDGEAAVENNNQTTRAQATIIELNGSRGGNTSSQGLAKAPGVPSREDALAERLRKEMEIRRYRRRVRIVQWPNHSIVTPDVLASAAVRFTTARHPPDADCDMVAKLDNFNESLPLDPVPEQCRLGVVVAGLPRSGSSTQYNMTIEITRGLFSDEEHFHSLYWDFHKHMRLKPKYVDQHLIRTQAKLLRMGEDDVVVTKCHEYKPQLLRLCRKTVVLLSRRNLIESARSIIKANWLSGKRFEEFSSEEYSARIRGFLEASINRYECWKQHSDLAIEVEFENISRESASFLKDYVMRAGINASPEIISLIAQYYGATEGNPSIPSTKSKGMSPEWEAGLSRAFAESEKIQDFQRRYGYPQM